MTDLSKLDELYMEFVKADEKLAFINEAVLNSIYKGTIFMSDDDIKFLDQFPVKYWKSALFQRYDKYLWEYLLKLQDARNDEYKKEYQNELRDEYSKISSDIIYSSLPKDAAIKLAKENAKNTAKNMVDKTIRIRPEDNINSPFDLQSNRYEGVRIFANPYIEDLVKKLEGTANAHDGFDLHNPIEVERKGRRESNSKLRKYTDGFVFPTKESIEKMIDNYLKSLGHGIIKYDKKDLAYKDTDPNIDEKDRKDLQAFYKKLDKFNDNMTYELLMDELVKKSQSILEKDHEENERARIAGIPNTPENKMSRRKRPYTGGAQKLFADARAMAKDLLDAEISQNKVHGPEHPETGQRQSVGLDSKGKYTHPEIHLPHKNVHIKSQKLKFVNGQPVEEGEVSVERVPNPILKPGHYFRKLKPKELEILDKIDLKMPLTEEEEAIYEKVFKNNHLEVLRGSHYDFANKKYRSLYIDSSHEIQKNAQGTSHNRAGGLHPNAESPERQFLGKYDVKVKKDLFGNIIEKEKVENPEYVEKVRRFFSDSGLGSSVKKIINDTIVNRLADKSEKKETFYLDLERSIMRLATPQLVDMGMAKVFQNLGVKDIERDPSKVKHLITNMLMSIEQQNLVRGSRRKRLNLGIADISSEELENLYNFSNSFACNVDQFRKSQTGHCEFSYRLDNLIKLSDDMYKGVGDIEVVIDSGEENSELLFSDLIKSFQYGVATLTASYFAKLVHENPKEDWNSISTRNEYADKARLASEDFVLNQLKATTNPKIAAGLIRTEIKNILSTVPQYNEKKSQELSNTPEININRRRIQDIKLIPFVDPVYLTNQEIGKVIETIKSPQNSDYYNNRKNLFDKIITKLNLELSKRG